MYNIYIYHFITLLGRNCLVFLRTALPVLYAYAAEIACLRCFQRVYFIVGCTWLRGRISSVPCWVSRPRQLAGSGEECAVEADDIPLPRVLTFCFGSRAFDVAVADASICLGVRA